MKAQPSARGVLRAWPIWGPLLVVILTLLIGSAAAAAHERPSGQPSPFHPSFALLDTDGRNVIQSGGPVSTMETCGQCHDTAFIQGHSFHSDVGLKDFGPAGATPTGRAWDMSSGVFGKWDPLTYRYLTPADGTLLDMGTASWIQTVGQRHVGGGPAQLSRDGRPLQELPYQPGDPETNILDPESGELIPWDWQQSGTIEMNCFLCHIEKPDNRARLGALESGNFRWANTATLQGRGIIQAKGEGYRWLPSAFDASGEVLPDRLGIQDPDSENCGLCHGLTDVEVERPLTFDSCLGAGRRTATTGQVISPQRISDSGLNLIGKDTLNRSWDIHAERLVSCTDCHYSLNNPVYVTADEGADLEHLAFDPRRLELGEYLYQPIHEFARGDSAQGTIAPELKGTIRGCQDCHEEEATHDWLPYPRQHFAALSCESCHVPELYGGGLQTLDWTVYDQGPRATCRLLAGSPQPSEGLLEGYQPVLLPRTDAAGETKLAPFNLVTIFYWVYGDPPRPVREIDLKAAWTATVDDAPDRLAALEDNIDQTSATGQLALASEVEVDLIRQQLIALGLEDPQIVGEIQPYSINHSVTGGEWATRDCESCHSRESRVTAPILLAEYLPGAVEPSFAQNSTVRFEGSELRVEEGKLYLWPNAAEQGLYLFGHDFVWWIDRGGALVFLLVLGAVGTHGGLRLLKRNPHNQVGATKKVYMYGFYERLWHWLQTLAISALLLTGLIIHRPDVFGALSFRHVVLLHNILAGILVVNAALALFYHLASGEIRQFLPRPAGFFSQAIVQARYYLLGIFRGAEHPYAKTPERKLNPLQQITYIGILNVLLPLQVISGLLMWGVSQWPQLAASLGGLPFLAPLHTLVAWLFAAFIVAHVYLTTTAGPKPLAAIQAMMLGWDEVEINQWQEESDAR